jgi:hypothetical protein
VSAVAFKIDGLDDLRAQLLAFTGEAAAEGAEIVEDETERAFSEIYAGYPRRSGGIRRNVKVVTTKTPYGATGTVINSDPLANIFENGSQARHTKLGAFRGSMPPGHVFIPVIQRHRRAMVERLRGVLERRGLTVTDAG